jgi:hypothetical protein
MNRVRTNALASELYYFIIFAAPLNLKEAVRLPNFREASILSSKLRALMTGFTCFITHWLYGALKTIVTTTTDAIRLCYMPFASIFSH